MPLVTALAKKILLVEDDEDSRSLMRAFLRQEGYEVYSCGDANRALDICSADKPIDLLVTDLKMPGPSGLELAVRLNQRRPSLPVLIVSGAILSHEEEEMIHVHAWNFLAKPVGVTTLLSSVAGMLQNPKDAEEMRSCMKR